MNTSWTVNLAPRGEPQLVPAYRVLAISIVVFLASFGLGLSVWARASATPPHEVWVASAFARVPVSVADRAPERSALKAEHGARFVAAIAKVSADAPLPPRQWSSLLLAIGGAESNFDTDVVNGNCPPKRCDPKTVKGQVVHQARGAFQNHPVSYNAELWQVANGNPEVQVEMADRALRRSLATCKPFASFPGSVFRAYGARSCSFPLKDEPRRIGLYLRLMATPTPAGEGA